MENKENAEKVVKIVRDYKNESNKNLTFAMDFIMSDFDNQLAHFVKVFPRDYKAVLLQKEKNNQKAI
jgi:glutamate synthase (NADPH/NADH) large chain